MNKLARIIAIELIVAITTAAVDAYLDRRLR